MILLETQLSASEVLHAFHRDEPYLILGSAYTTVALVSIGYCVMRRRFDALLVWMAVFAHLYGQRLWMNASLLRMTIPDTEFFRRLSAATDYLVPIPAVLFFHAAGLLGRWGKAIAMALAIVFGMLVLGVSFFGQHSAFRLINNAVVVALIAAC